MELAAEGVNSDADRCPRDTSFTNPSTLESRSVKLRCCWQLLSGLPLLLPRCSAACASTAVRMPLAPLLLLRTEAIAVAGRRSKLLAEAIRKPVAGNAGSSPLSKKRGTVSKKSGALRIMEGRVALLMGAQCLSVQAKGLTWHNIWYGRRRDRTCICLTWHMKMHCSAPDGLLPATRSLLGEMLLLLAWPLRPALDCGRKLLPATPSGEGPGVAVTIAFAAVAAGLCCAWAAAAVLLLFFMSWMNS